MTIWRNIKKEGTIEEAWIKLLKIYGYKGPVEDETLRNNNTGKEAWGEHESVELLKRKHPDRTL